jgi:hypothetical protein
VSPTSACLYHTTWRTNIPHVTYVNPALATVFTLVCRSALCKGHSFSIILEASETQVFHDSPNQSRRRPTQETPPRLSGDRHPPLLAPNFLIASVDRRFRPLTFKFRLRKSFQPRSRCTLASFIRMCSTRRHMSATPQLLHTW